jgi:uncharacterized protein YqjF (DUF2071 family)
VFWSPADLLDALRQPHAAFAEKDHRPWALPNGPWVMAQTWRDLLFAHWPVDPEALRRHVPDQIPIDTFDGHAWVGVTPFIATGVRPRLGLPLPGVSRFPEVNVRTYATIDGRPGIWFFSLDTPNPLVNEAARRTYRVPYFRSQIGVQRHGDRIRWASRRTQPAAPAAALALSYAPVGPSYTAAPDSFEEFATERYCLYVLDDDERVLRAEIQHPRWRLQRAKARIVRNAMGAELDLDLSGEPVLHLGRRQDVVFWLPRRVRAL